MNTARLLASYVAALALGAAVSAAGITPVRIEKTVEPRFPNALAFATINSGEARVVICVDASGRLTDLLVSGYTDKAFADEAVRALRQWTYTPASRNGEPIGVRLELRFDFSAPGRVVSMMAMEAADVLVRSFVPTTMVTRICQPGELDRPVAAVQTVEPPHPGLVPGAPTQTGSTVIDFYVDENGQARMPVVVRATHEDYAQAAVSALNQWRFAPPTRHGQPVAVRVQQEFIFPSSS